MENVSNDDFDALVQQELRGGCGREQLMQTLDEWWEALIRTKQDLECQFGARKLEIIGAPEEERARYYRWRPGALRVLAGVELRLSLIRASSLN